MQYTIIYYSITYNSICPRKVCIPHIFVCYKKTFLLKMYTARNTHIV